MDVMEKLVDIVCDATQINRCIHSCNHPPCAMVRGIVDALIENGVTVQEWISTDKRMPTQEDATTEYVFTAYKNKNCYDVNISLWDTVIAYPDLYDYWMPLSLPQPPKGE